MSFETQRHRGTQRSSGSVTQSSRVAPKVLGVHLEKREPPPKSPARQIPLPHTRLTPDTQCSSENCPYRACVVVGGADPGLHPGLMELALRAVNTAWLFPAIFGFLQHHRLRTGHRPIPPTFGPHLKRYGASRPVTTGNFSIHHRTARAVPLKVAGIGLAPSVLKVRGHPLATNAPAAPDWKRRECRGRRDVWICRRPAVNGHANSAAPSNKSR